MTGLRSARLGRCHYVGLAHQLLETGEQGEPRGGAGGDKGKVHGNIGSQGSRAVTVARQELMWLVVLVTSAQPCMQVPKLGGFVGRQISGGLCGVGGH